VNVSANGKTNKICKMKERNEKILEFQKQGLTQQKIAEKVGITRQRVAQIANNVNVSANGKTNKICNLNNSKNLDHQQRHKRTTLTENQHSSEAELPEKASLASLEKAEVISFFVQDKGLEDIPGGGDSYHSHGKPEEISQSPDNSTANDIRDISSYLNSLNIYKKLSPENKKAIRAMELVKLYGQDVIDIMDEIGESPIWIRKILVAAISLALMGGHETKDVVKVTDALEIDSKVGEVIRQFLPYGKMLCPIGPHMELWVEENLSKKDMDLIAKLAGVHKSDLPYRIRGEKPPKTRHHKKPPVEELNRINEDVAILRGWRDDVRKRAYDNKGKRIIQAYSNKITKINNELLDAIGTYYPDETKKMPFGGKSIRMEEGHVDQFANIVNTIVRKNRYRLPPGITPEDLEAECWVRVLKALKRWDGTKGDINVWVRYNLELKIKDLYKKEYQRQKTISRYLTDADIIVGRESSDEG
ncbi:MAG TPA: helix-turn-helix domain-containing protein, partial [Desulfobacteraceae bacterium]|nr:helix-turn-helix domain-containing protein [Desulfobacteraceae bacterium]